MSESLNETELEEQHQVFLLQMAGMAVVAAATPALVYAAPLHDKIPYHTSALSGEEWVQELINDHPEHIHCELGVHKDIFKALIANLRNIGHSHSQYVMIEEQLSIFFYKCITGLSIWHVGQHFQHFNDTISQYEYFWHIIRLQLIIIFP